MKKWLIVGGVALLVLIVARKAAAAPSPYDAANWSYVPGYRPGSGAVL